MSTEIHFVHTKTWQTDPNGSVEETPVPSGCLVMRFIHYKRIGSRLLHTIGDITYDAPDLLLHRAVVINPSEFLSHRSRFTGMLNQLISSDMPLVPEDERRDIVKKTFDAVEVAVLGLVIDISIVDTTVRLLGCARTVEEYQKIVDEVTMEFMHISRRIAATKLSIEGLEKVSLDSLDLTVRQAPCIICREDLDHIDVVENNNIHPPMVARLPCSHMYHGDCIVDWLLISHLCPLCRYPIPVVKVPCELPSLKEVDDRLIGELQIVEVEREGPVAEVSDDQPTVNVAGEQPHLEATNQPLIASFQVGWPILLNMSAGGIIAAIMLLRRLLK